MAIYLPIAGFDYATTYREIIRTHYAEREAIVRSLLGQWASELEPTIVESGGRILGLAYVGNPGIIVVRVPE